MSYLKKHEHEKKCIYVPCSCSHSNCILHQLIQEVISAFQKWTSKFQDNIKLFISIKNGQVLVLQEQNEGNLFVVKTSARSLGTMVQICSIGPSSSGERFIYDLSAKSKTKTIRLSSVMESIQNRIHDSPSKEFLLVPCGFLGSSGQLRLVLCIRPCRLLKNWQGSLMHLWNTQILLWKSAPNSWCCCFYDVNM